MKCKHIILVSFYTNDTKQNNEITDSREAYSKKYEATSTIARVNCTIQTEGWEKKALDDLKAVRESINSKDEPTNVGMYLLLHADTKDTEPEAVKLAELVSNIINDGLILRKINITGCFGAGGAYTSDIVQKSALTRFCSKLAERVKDDKRANMKKLAVCGYQGVVATYEPGCNYCMSKFKPIDNTYKSDWSGGEREGVGLIRTIIAREGGKTWMPTHLTKKTDINAIEGIPKTVQETAWKQAKLGDDKQRVLKDQEKGKLNKKLKTAAYKAINDNDILVSLSKYIQTKIVLVYDHASNKFKMGSLADYTDNETMRQMVVVTEDLMEKRGSIRLTLTT
jgi:hypothetical protein